MSHGIIEIDKGVVWGDTWHGLPQYVTQDTPVTMEQAYNVLDFEILKVPLYYLGNFDTPEDATPDMDLDPPSLVPGAFALVRPDHNQVLVPMVGSRFEVVPNVDLLTAVDAEVLSQAPALDIESVGTLFGGATQFVNVKINQYAIPGDNSPTIGRLMYYNPLGKGCYQVVAHNVRVVCNNTLNMASSGAKARVKVRHTASAGEKISEAMLDMARVYADFEEQKELLLAFSREPMDTPMIDTFLDNFCPVPEIEEGEKLGRAQTLAFNAQDTIREAFEANRDTMTQELAYSKYGMLQAVTYTLDHEDPKRGHDVASIAWDGITGTRALRKQVAVDLLRVA